MIDYAEAAGAALGRIRESNPLVHSITNYVVMNSTANVLLAMGAAPIMAHAPEEMEEIVAFPGAMVINIGTLSNEWIKAMVMAVKLADKAGKPWVLDPVGAGATNFRTSAVKKILETAKPSVIRGNASEILAISPQGGKTKGVDSINKMEDAINAAKTIANELGTVVAITGERDLVTDGDRSLVITGGHHMMAKVTGTGCAASVIVGAFLAVEEDPLLAAAYGLAFFGVAGAKAGMQTDWPGTFWINTVDQLYAVTPAQVSATARIEET